MTFYSIAPSLWALMTLHKSVNLHNKSPPPGDSLVNQAHSLCHCCIIIHIWNIMMIHVNIFLQIWINITVEVNVHFLKLWERAETFLFCSWFVCEQDYTKSTERIFMKFGGRKWFGSGKNWLNFDVDPYQGLDPRSFFSPSLTLRFLTLRECWWKKRVCPMCCSLIEFYFYYIHFFVRLSVRIDIFFFAQPDSDVNTLSPETCNFLQINAAFKSACSEMLQLCQSSVDT